MTTATNIQSLATRVATECKSLRTMLNGNMVGLTDLTTTAKSSLVAAVNELQGEIEALTQIDDGSTSASSTWSSTKISGEISSALSGVLDGAPAALDTLNELAAALGDDANFASTVTTALGNRVRVDAVQAFTEPQMQQARDNIDVYSKAELGDPTTNFVTTFETGLV